MANIRGYTKKLGGKTVTVTPYSTRASAAAEENGGDPRKVPGRPPLAAGIGRFPNDRIIPNVFITPVVKPPAPPEMEEPEDQATLEKKLAQRKEMDAGKQEEDDLKPTAGLIKKSKKVKQKDKVSFSAAVDELVRLTR